MIAEIRGESDPGSSGGGGPLLLRRVPVSDANGGASGQAPSNGIIPSDITMMEPILQDQAFQQQILQVIDVLNVSNNNNKIPIRISFWK